MVAKKALAKRADARKLNATHQKWAQRHPELAREERGFRVANAAVDKRRDLARAGTPETIDKASRTQQGALARMFMSGAITADQLAASDEVRRVHERLARDVTVATMSMETRVSGGGRADGGFFEKLGAVRAEVAYTRWRAALPQPGPVLAMIVEDLGCNQAAARFRKDKRTLGRLLSNALDAWYEFQARARDEIDDATLLAAQAGIL